MSDDLNKDETRTIPITLPSALWQVLDNADANMPPEENYNASTYIASLVMQRMALLLEIPFVSDITNNDS